MICAKGTTFPGNTPGSNPDAVGIVEDRKGWLFRTARGRNGGTFSAKPMSRPHAWRMIRRRAAAPKWRGKLLFDNPLAWRAAAQIGLSKLLTKTSWFRRLQAFWPGAPPGRGHGASRHPMVHPRRAAAPKLVGQITFRQSAGTRAAAHIGLAKLPFDNPLAWRAEGAMQWKIRRGAIATNSLKTRRF